MMNLRQRKYMIESNDLQLVSISDGGIRFKTGSPVAFQYYRFAQNTGDFGSRFGQDIEPAGKYVSLLTKHVNLSPEMRDAYAKQGMKVETGKLSFKNPLVLKYGGYGANGWKARLSEHFGGKKKRALSKAIVKAGHDGIVAVDKKEAAEIVSLKGM